jgi:GMP synthase-like glutamine amidotransferase
MLLFISNARDIPNDLGFVPKIRKALKYLHIPFYEVKKVQEIPPDILNKIKGILISGSTMRIGKPILFEEFSYIIRYLILFPDIPVLGLCFGCQVLHNIYGGKLEVQPEKNCDKYHTILTEHPLFKNVSFLSIDDTHQKFPVCFTDLPLTFPKKSPVKTIASFYHREKNVSCAFQYSSKHYGMMIHPEMYKETYSVFSNFAKICEM